MARARAQQRRLLRRQALRVRLVQPGLAALRPRLVRLPEPPLLQVPLRLRRNRSAHGSSAGCRQLDRLPAIRRGSALPESQHDRPRLLRGDEGLTAQAVPPCQQPQTAKAACEGRHAGRIGLHRCRGIPLTIIQNTKIDICPRRRHTVFVRHADGQAAHISITGRFVAIDHIALAADEIRTRLRLAEAAAVHQNGASGRTVEPAAVQHGLRLTGTEKVPRAAAPDLDPRMVVVTVRPARHIDLPRRKAAGAQDIHRKHGLLTAAAEARAEHGQRTARALVRRLIGHMLGAPAVDLQNGGLLRKAAQPLGKRGIEHGAAVTQRLVIDARMQHIGKKQRLRQGARPRNVLPQVSRMRRAGEKHLRRRIEPVAGGACRIAKAGQPRRLVRQGLQKVRKLPKARLGELPLKFRFPASHACAPGVPRACTVSAHARNSASSVSQSSYSERDGRPMDTPSLR